MQSRDKEKRVFTIPNLLSTLRLCAVPVFVWLLFGRDNRAGAALLLAVLAATDCLDGYIARHFDQVSNLGKILDPVADRVLLGVGVVSALIDGAVPAWVAWAVIAREALVSVAGLALAALGARRIDVRLVGKAGTFLLLVTFPLFLLAESTFAWREVARWLAWTFAVPGLVLSWWSAAAYVPVARRALADGRSRRTRSPATAGGGEVR